MTVLEVYENIGSFTEAQQEALESIKNLPDDVKAEMVKQIVG